jgi:hypothetical protein
VEHAPGIYFGLDESVYHADPALSSSGIRNLLVSPLDYWVNSSLNPDYVDEKTDAMITGTAFHRRLLEPVRFAELYAGAPSKEDYPDAIDGGEALKAECERLGLKKGGKIEDLCDRILDSDPKAKLWPVIKQGILAGLEGKTLLKRETMADIERVARFVFAHESAAKALTGGAAEVSIFWLDPETGVRMKARLDYLKVKAIADVKSFSNPLAKPIDAAVASAVANGRYDVQAVIYDVAVAHAKAMLRRDKTKAIHHVSGPVPENDWLVSLAACERHAFAFVFIETGPVTNVRVREFRKTESYGGLGGTINLYWQSGETGFREGLRRYVQCMKIFGKDKPWVEDEPMRPFNDQEFPLYLFN